MKLTTLLHPIFFLFFGFIIADITDNQRNQHEHRHYPENLYVQKLTQFCFAVFFHQLLCLLRNLICIFYGFPILLEFQCFQRAFVSFEYCKGDIARQSQRIHKSYVILFYKKHVAFYLHQT